MNKNFSIVSRMNGVTKGKGTEVLNVVDEQAAKTVTEHLNGLNDGKKYSYKAIDPPQVYTAEQAITIIKAQQAVQAARQGIILPVSVTVESVTDVTTIPVKVEATEPLEAFTMPD